jgi:hypothetical protein
MLVMINRDAWWSLGFEDQAWSLQAGESIPLLITFDAQSPWSGTAHALGPHLVTIPMAVDSALVTAFRGAYQMQVEADGRTFAFNLGGTSRLMVELAQCVSTQLALERGKPLPQYAGATPREFRAVPAPPQQPSTSNADLELAAIRIASNLLLQAHLPNAHLLSPSETPAALRRAWVQLGSPMGALAR